MKKRAFSDLARQAQAPKLDEKPPFSVAWWREQPPEPLAATVRRFQQIGHREPPAVRRYLEKHLPPLDVAEQLDGDLAAFWKRAKR